MSHPNSGRTSSSSAEIKADLLEQVGLSSRINIIRTNYQAAKNSARLARALIMQRVRYATERPATLIVIRLS
jgi:hypothetical protein